YVPRVAAVTPADAAQAAEQHMPTPEQIAIVVVGKADEIRPALEARFGPVRVATREACDAPLQGRRLTGAGALRRGPPPQGGSGWPRGLATGGCAPAPSPPVW